MDCFAQFILSDARGAEGRNDDKGGLSSLSLYIALQHEALFQAA
jgi:hypothetical protein